MFGYQIPSNPIYKHLSSLNSIRQSNNSQIPQQYAHLKSQIQSLIMQQSQSPDIASQYRNILLSIRQKYQKPFNIYMRNQLVRKQSCYKSGPSPNQPIAYYECMQKIEKEMMDNSQRLVSMVNTLDEEDRTCKDTCRRSFEIDDKYNACVQKCVKKFGDGLHGAYAKYYDGLLAADGDYRKVKK